MLCMVEKKVRKRKSTETSAFGTSGREGHDSSKFYSRILYDGQQREKKQVTHVENPFPHKYLDSIVLSSSENMKELPDNCVQLMVTSPPYDVGKEYDNNQSLDDYLEFLNRVWMETYRVLVPGGRACINIANLGRKPYIPLHAYIIKDLQDVGFLMRGEVIWDKGASAGTSTAWGSWCSATNPTLRDVHEYILIFSKESFSRVKENDGNEREDTISKEQFLEYTKSIWSFPTESAKKIGHPAPFPIELPSRVIELYTFKDDVILDPFMGSGQSALAAIKLHRHFVGYEINAEYKDLAEKRIKKYWQDVNSPTLFDFQEK